MLDFENTFKHLSFTSVRDAYKTRELVNIIRAKLPASCENKNFSGKVMLHNKTKNSCGLYLRCLEKTHVTAHTCNFKVFFRLDMEDNIYRLYERSENTSFVCTCPADYVTQIKEDQEKHMDVVNEVLQADKKNPAIEPTSKIPGPIFIKDSEKKTYLKSVAMIRNTVPNRSVKKPKAPAPEIIKLSNVLRVSTRKRDSQQRETRSSTTVTPKSSSPSDDDTEVMPDISRTVPLDFEGLFETIRFSATKNAGHGIVREMCNDAIKATGVDKAFTYKLGMGRAGGNFTADSVYVRCCKKQGYSEKCELRALFKRDKSNDIWSLSRNTSHVQFLCHCDNYVTTEMAIERATKKKSKDPSPLIKKSSSVELASVNNKRKSEDSDSSFSSVEEVPVKRQKIIKLPEDEVKMGALEEAFYNFDFSLGKKDAFTEENLKNIISKNLEKFSIKRSFSIAMFSDPKVVEKLIIKLHMDESDSVDKEERFGDKCKISAFCYKDFRNMKKMKVLKENVDTNFDCNCKTCMKYKMQSSEYLKKNTLKEVKHDKKLILPVDYRGKTIKQDTCADFSCDKCSEILEIKQKAERMLDYKMNALFNRFD